MRAFLLFTVFFVIVIITQNFCPVFTISQRTLELVFGATGIKLSRLSAALLCWSVWAALSVIFYMRERSYREDGDSAPRAFVKSWRFFLLAAAALNALVYVGLALVKKTLAPGVSRTFGLGDIPLLVVDPLAMSMGYAILRCAMVDFTAWIKITPRDTLDVGNQVLHDPAEAFAAFQRKADEQETHGLALHPAVRIPPALETRHLLLVSAPGGGKTQVMFPMLTDILARGFPALVYDFKGDYTEAFGEDQSALILSPFDGRGVAWDIARDVDTPLRAMEFAAQLLPHHKAEHPFFPRAAQDLLTGVVIKLQRELPGAWTFRELVSLLETREAVALACRAYRPAALTALGSLEDKQAAGVFGELRTGTIQLDYLAQAWAGAEERFSVRDWLTDDAQKSARRLVILKGSQQYRELDGFFTATVFTLLIKEVLALSDSYERQLWAFLDEFDNLPRIEGVDKLLTAVRSKGLRVVAAIQDIAQIEEAYSRPFAQTFFGAFGTLLAGLAAGDTAAYLSRAFGQNQMTRRLTSETSQGGFGTDSITQSESVVIENALLDSEFSGLEPPGQGRPARFWLKTAGWPIGQLEYPITPTPKIYAASVPNLRLLGTSTGAAAETLAAAAVVAAAATPPSTKRPRIEKRDLGLSL